MELARARISSGYLGRGPHDDCLGSQAASVQIAESPRRGGWRSLRRLGWSQLERRAALIFILASFLLKRYKHQEQKNRDEAEFHNDLHATPSMAFMFEPVKTFHMRGLLR